MDLDTARDFLRAHPRGVLATLRRDGTPQLSPVVAALGASGDLLVSTRETAVKTRNVRRDPRAWFVALPNGFFAEPGGRSHVQVEARVRVVSLPEAMDLLVEYYRTLSGEHPDWADYRAAMVRDRRCVLRLEPTRAGPDIAG